METANISIKTNKIVRNFPNFASILYLMLDVQRFLQTQTIDFWAIYENEIKNKTVVFIVSGLHFIFRNV